MKPPAGDLPHQLGQATGELKCGAYGYYLYFPTSLRQGEKHPVLFLMHPQGGSPATFGSYRPAAERNRWILAVSKDSKNGFKESDAANDAMFAKVMKTLPVDPKRIYSSGFSGGGAQALHLAARHKEIAGVIPCGMGGAPGSARQAVYGLCGTNCYNRRWMAAAFKDFRGRNSILRFFPGKHDWAGPEPLDDAVTHLNGLFLIANQRDYPGACQHYLRAVSGLVRETKDKNPMRAFLWTSFLNDRKVLPPDLAAVNAELAKVPENVLYVQGLAEIGGFAGKTMGGDTAETRVSAACRREAEKYAGTPWREILIKMSEEPQKR